jgi:DNA-binding MarR family transcriptional regulator
MKLIHSKNGRATDDGTTQPMTPPATPPTTKASEPDFRERAAAGLVLDRFVPYRLSVLSNTVSRAIARIYAERFKLAIPDWRVMAVLGQEAPLSARDVCARTAMDKVRVSRALGRLIERGIVVRTVAERDRRRSVLSLSAAGEAIYAEIAPLALNAEAKLLDELSEEERHLLDLLLRKLLDRAGEAFAIDGETLESPND